MYIHCRHIQATWHSIWSVFTYVHSGSYNIRFINIERERKQIPRSKLCYGFYVRFVIHEGRNKQRNGEWDKIGKKSDLRFFSSSVCCQRPLSAFHSTLSCLNNWKCLEDELERIKSYLKFVTMNLDVAKKIIMKSVKWLSCSDFVVRFEISHRFNIFDFSFIPENSGWEQLRLYYLHHSQHARWIEAHLDNVQLL